MTLTETALAFVRECLGWADAKVLSHDPEAESPRLVVMSARAKADTLFAVTDFRDVEATVRIWCTANGLEHTVKPASGQQPATAVVTKPKPAGESARLSSVSDPDPAVALMAACVEAQRKLRAP
jgi:hypothetical protein